MRKAYIVFTLFALLLTFPLKADSAPAKKAQTLNQYLYKLEMCIDSGNYKEATSILNRIYPDNSKNPRLNSLAARLFYETGNYQEAEVIALKNLEYQKNIDNYLILGNIYLAKSEEGESKEEKKSLVYKAFQCFYSADRLNKRHPDVKVALAKAEMALNNYQKAFDLLMEAKDMDMTNPDVYHQLGLVYKHHGKYEKAVEYLLESVSYEYRPNINKYLLMADLYEKLGDIENAIYFYNRVLEVDNEHVYSIDRIKYLENIYNDYNHTYN